MQDCFEKNSGSSSGYPSSPHSTGPLGGRIRRQRWEFFLVFLENLGEENIETDPSRPGWFPSADNVCNKMSFGFPRSTNISWEPVENLCILFVNPPVPPSLGRKKTRNLIHILWLWRASDVSHKETNNIINGIRSNGYIGHLPKKINITAQKLHRPLTTKYIDYSYSKIK